MKEVTVGKFRANLSHYLGLMRAGETLVLNGHEYAWIGKKACTRGGKGVVTKKKMAEVSEKSVYTGGVYTEAVATENACEKCGKGGELYKIWEDGEERVVCLVCLKIEVPAKMLRGYLRRCRKLT